MALSLVLILIAGINFSLLIPVNKIAGDAGFPNFAYVFWYALGAGLILLIPAIIRRELPQLTVPHLRLYFVSATLGFAFPFALLAFVATKLPSGVTVLLITLTPLFTYSLAVIARLERFQPICAAGLLAGIAGVLLIVIPGDSLPAPSMAVWFLIALLIPFGFGALNVIVERFRPPEASSLGLAIGNLFAGALLLLPFLPATGQLYLFPGPDLDGDLALVAAVVINAIMWPMFYIIVRRAGASLFSIMTIIGVVGGIGWGVLFFDETHSAYVWGAAGLMLAAFVMMVIGSILLPRDAARAPNERPAQERIRHLAHDGVDASRQNGRGDRVPYHPGRPVGRLPSYRSPPPARKCSPMASGLRSARRWSPGVRAGLA